MLIGEAEGAGYGPFEHDPVKWIPDRRKIMRSNREIRPDRIRRR
jgi:hypothetical protein